MRKTNRGEGIISRISHAEECYDFLGLFYCFIVLLLLLYTCVDSLIYVIYLPNFMAQYNLFVLKVLLNPKQTNHNTWSLQRENVSKG